MGLPAVLGMMALDPVIDLIDTGIDFGTLIQNQIIMQQNSVTQAMVTYDMLILISQSINDKIEDIEDDYEISKIQRALYDAKLLNNLLGNALNYGASEGSEVVRFDDTVYDWDIPSWLQWIEDAFLDLTGLPGDHFDFRKMWKFRDDTDTVDMFLTDEQKYCNAKWPRYVV